MTVRILHGDCRAVMATLPEQSVHCCVTSPPYFGLRNYGHEGQIGLEDTPDAYVAQLVEVFRAVRRVLRDDGTLWLNLGDSYSGGGGFSPDSPSNKDSKQATQGSRIYKGRNPAPGLKPKDLIGIPWRVAFALQADGWYLRQDIVWHKPNPMPESVTDRCTKAHEYVFLLSKGPRYYYDAAAIKEPQSELTLSMYGDREGGRQERDLGKYSKQAGRTDSASLARNVNQDGMRNKRSVWTIATQPFAEAHFATMAPELAETCVRAGCPEGGTVLDPFGGAGTTGLVADRLQRDAVLCELNPDYIEIARRRIHGDAPLFADVEAA